TAVAMVLVPDVPWARERLEGDAEIEKSSMVAGAMVTLTVVLCVAEVAAPVTVSVYVPAAAVPALTVSVLEPPAVTEVGLSEALAPPGTPDTLRFTVSALPEVTAVLMVLVPLPPALRDSEPGLALMEKS